MDHLLTAVLAPDLTRRWAHFSLFLNLRLWQRRYHTRFYHRKTYPSLWKYRPMVEVILWNHSVVVLMRVLETQQQIFSWMTFWCNGSLACHCLRHYSTGSLHLHFNGDPGFVRDFFPITIFVSGVGSHTLGACEIVYDMARTKKGKSESSNIRFIFYHKIVIYY